MRGVWTVGATAWLWLVAGTLPAVAGQTPALPLSLDEAVDRALTVGQEGRLARTRVDLADVQVTAARAEALPAVRADAGYVRTFASPFDTTQPASLPDDLQFAPDPTGSVEDRLSYLEQNAPNAGLAGLSSLFEDFPLGRDHAYSASLTVEQLLYSGGRVGAARRIAGLVRDVAQLTLAEDLAEVRRSVRTAYYQALLAQELVAIAREALAQADRVLQMEQVRRAAGRAAELDVLRAEVSRDNLRPQLVDAETALDLALLNLKRLVDLPLDRDITLTTPLEAPPAAAAAPSDPSTLAAGRAAVIAALRQIDIRSEQARVTEGDYRPRVTAAMTFGQQLYPRGMFDLGSGWRTDWSAGVSMSVPIFSGYLKPARLAQAEIERQQAELAHEQLLQAVQVDYQRAVGDRARARAAITARTRTVEVAERAYELTLLVFEQGLGTELEVSDARLQLLQARSDLAAAIAQFHMAEADVDRDTTTAPCNQLTGGAVSR